MEAHRKEDGKGIHGVVEEQRHCESNHGKAVVEPLDVVPCVQEQAAHDQPHGNLEEKGIRGRRERKRRETGEVVEIEGSRVGKEAYKKGPEEALRGSQATSHIAQDDATEVPASS